MPKAGVRFYAVRAGREGPKVYTTWDEALQNTDRFPGAVQKSFKSRAEAEAWITVHPSLLSTYVNTSSVKTSPSQRELSAAEPSRLASPDSQSSRAIFITQQQPHDMECSSSSSSSSRRRIKDEPTPEWTVSGTSTRAASASPTKQMKGDHGPAQPQVKLPVVNEFGNQIGQFPVLPPVPMPPADIGAGIGTFGDTVGPASPPIQLSDEQRAVLDMVKRGKNVFFTGSAGTGKSVLLREIIKHCRTGRWGRLAITASTGIASVNIGGSTIHSWAGIGLGKESAEKLVGKLLGQMLHWQKKAAMMPQDEDNNNNDGETDVDFQFKSKKSPTVDKWREVTTLIIDEISMIDGVLFDKLEYIARALRKNSAPFGGIQLILSGDFCQLPPVPEREKGAQIPATFAFDAKSWERCVGKPVMLTKVFRQKDQAFVDMLNGMRFGHLDQATIIKFRNLSRPVKYDDDIEPTDLFPTRKEVDAANSNRLNKLKEAPRTYVATDAPGYDDNGRPISLEQMNRLLERLVTPKTITLKVGAQVMLTKNMVQGSLVNGSIGRVIGFMTTREANDKGVAIGKANGENTVGVPGPRVVPRVAESMIRSNAVWPVVKFQNTVEMLCVPMQFEVNDADGKVEAARGQVPLILAWALSIHKSQGQTLQRVRVNLGRIFEKGQAYVALSRATCMDTLQVLNFDPAKVMAHPRVLAWMEEQTGARYHDDVDETLEFWADL